MTISSKDEALCPLNEFIIYNNDDNTKIVSQGALDAVNLVMAEDKKGVNKYTFSVGSDKNVAKSAKATGELVICGGETLSLKADARDAEDITQKPPAAGEATTKEITLDQYKLWFESTEPKCGVVSYALV